MFARSHGTIRVSTDSRTSDDMESRRCVILGMIGLLLFGCSSSRPPAESSTNETRSPVLALSSLRLQKSVVVPRSNFCAVVWSEAWGHVLSDPTNACIVTNGNVRTVGWNPVLDSPITNYIVGWAYGSITNLVPDSNIQWTNVGLQTNLTFIVSPITTNYGLIFLQGSTDLVNWSDLSLTPYLRITNGDGGPLPWQFFRSRT